MMEAARRQLDQRNAEQERLCQADADFRRRMATATGPTAIAWREAHRQADAASLWLAAHRNEERWRFDHRQRCRTKRDLEYSRYLEWKHYHPEPPQRLWNRRQRETWEQERDKARAPLETAHAEYQHAKTHADLPALDALNREREQHERAQARAIAERQRLALLPSEQHAQQKMQRLTFRTRPELEEIRPLSLPSKTRTRPTTPPSRGLRPPSFER